jgi:pimeloyl-ACP methyl ester carboxylesterase
MWNRTSLQIVNRLPVWPRLAAWLFTLAVVVLPSIEARASDYHVVSEQTVVYDLPLGKLRLTETLVQDGPQAINRFTMHRLRRPLFPHRGTLLLLPSLGNNFGMYLVHESGDVTRSFAAVFARLGYDVWGYSPRTSLLSAGQCGVALDCSAALGWSVQTIVDDVAFVRSRIQAASPGERPVIGGISLGAVAALAVVNQQPAKYAGLLAIEGSLITDDPVIRAHNQGFCAQFTALVNAGVAVDDQTLPFVKLVTQLAQVAPDDPFVIPVPGFPPGLTNHQAFVLILSVPNPIAPSPRPGFISAAGDVATDQLFYSDEARLAANIAVFDDVTANRVSVDLHCGLAGVDTTHTSNLASFTAPTLIIKAGQGFGSVMDELPGKLGSTSVVFHSREEFAHIDHFGSPAHAFFLEGPILQWLHDHVD